MVMKSSSPDASNITLEGDLQLRALSRDTFPDETDDCRGFEVHISHGFRRLQN